MYYKNTSIITLELGTYALQLQFEIIMYYAYYIICIIKYRKAANKAFT